MAEIILDIPHLTPALRQDLEESYQIYNDVIKMWTKDYAQNPTKETEDSLKSCIKAWAKKVRVNYDQNQYPADGIHLLAGIFALLVIKKAAEDETGSVEYNYEPHAAQIIAILLILGISAD